MGLCLEYFMLCNKCLHFWGPRPCRGLQRTQKPCVYMAYAVLPALPDYLAHRVSLVLCAGTLVHAMKGV